jgi:ubiquinone/menaquinone biosynthesis C-methylase UbiE
MSTESTLPRYSAELNAFHRAHRPELRQIISDLQLPQDARVLDVACGDGVYGGWIEEALGPTGIVIGADRSLAYLKLADGDAAGEHSYVGADIESLPFASDAFDVAWCAQSLVSVPDPLAAVKEMRRILRPGGQVVLLENDSLHELMLPWPEDLELAIRVAQWRSYRASKRRPEKRYIGRRLSSLMRHAGFAQISRKTYATDRIVPLTEAEKMFLTHYLESLRDTVWQYLPLTHQRQLDLITQPSSEKFILAQPDFEMTWLDVVCVGRKPDAS